MYLEGNRELSFTDVFLPSHLISISVDIGTNLVGFFFFFWLCFVFNFPSEYDRLAMCGVLEAGFLSSQLSFLGISFSDFGMRVILAS